MADLSAASLSTSPPSSGRTTAPTTPASAWPATSTRPRPEEAGREVLRPDPPRPRSRARSSRTCPSPDRVQEARSMTDDVRLSRTSIVWPTVPLGDPGRGRARRPGLDPRPAPQREPAVPKALIYNKQLAANANANHRTNLLAGTFSVSITPAGRPEARRPDRHRRRRDRPAQGRRADRRRGPARSRTSVESRSILGLQTVQAKSDFFNRNYVQHRRPRSPTRRS